jgi:hypothetical protein
VADTPITTSVWAAAMMSFTVLVGTRYGYLDAKPRAVSILNLLGDRPTYVVAEISIIVAAWHGAPSRGPASVLAAWLFRCCPLVSIPVVGVKGRSSLHLRGLSVAAGLEVADDAAQPRQIGV